NKGDYKFPGGGVKFGESIINALKREVEEETGYIVKDIKEKAGVAFQRNHDKYEKDAIFEMKSIYFFCTVSDSISEQNLDQYEKEQEFEPKWISVEEALKNNISIIKNQNNNPWLEREIEVLKKLNENIIK
ncbi:MAG TPA: NUDIX domain-containing protein, partial [Tepiditoga sp.]|nr:NUDIX domain-containing protein [Tepiditoga sp.]